MMEEMMSLSRFTQTASFRFALVVFMVCLPVLTMAQDVLPSVIKVESPSQYQNSYSEFYCMALGTYTTGLDYIVAGGSFTQIDSLNSN